METDQVARVVGEGLHAAQGGQQTETVYTQLVGIVLRDHAVIVGVAALNQSALDDAVAIVDLCVALIETNDHVAAVLAKQVAQQVGWFLRQDEGCGLFALDGVHLVAHQFVSVAGHHSQTVGCQVEIDTVHHGTQFVLGRSEDRAVDILGQRQVGYGDRRGIVAHGLCHRELIGILYRQREQTVLIADFHGVLLLVHIKGDRLLREALHSLQQVVVADGEAAVTVTLGQIQLGLHHVLRVRSGQIQDVVLDFEHEVAQDG